MASNVTTMNSHVCIGNLNTLVVKEYAVEANNAKFWAALFLVQYVNMS